MPKTRRRADTLGAVEALAWGFELVEAVRWNTGGSVTFAEIVVPKRRGIGGLAFHRSTASSRFRAAFVRRSRSDVPGLPVPLARVERYRRRLDAEDP